MEYPFIINSSNSVSVLWERKPYLAVPYVLTLGIAALIGTLGNLLVIATIALMFKRRRRNVGNVFVLNLAISDLIVTSIINPFSIVGVVKGVDFYHTYFGLCQGLASICVISCVVSLLTIGNIAINRYIYICHHSSYLKFYSTPRCVAACFICWLLGVAMDLPSHLGWSRHAFDRKSNKCLWDRRHRYEYTVFLMLVGVMTPLVVIVLFYVLIYKHVRKIKLRLNRHNNGRMPSSGVQVMRVAKQTRMMFLIFLGFSICWLPYIAVLLTDRFDEFPIEVHLLASMFAHLHASINFIIYGFGNSSFRQSYREIILRILSYCYRHKEYPIITRYSEGEPQDDVAVPEFNVTDVRTGCSAFLGCCDANNAHLDNSIINQSVNLASPLPDKPACVISPSVPQAGSSTEALLKFQPDAGNAVSAENHSNQETHFNQSVL